MLLLDTSFLIEFEDEIVNRKSGPAKAVLTARRRQAAAISIIRAMAPALRSRSHSELTLVLPPVI